MPAIESADGTRIAMARSGDGPPLVLVHGAGTDHAASWRLVLPELERAFTVHAMDRRGRGGSGDAAGYDLQREAEDVAAVVDAIGGPVDVVGHSYGGLCAIEAALLTPNLRRLVLYEAVPLRGSDGYPPGLIDRLEADLAKGDVEGMLLAMMREVVGRSEQEIALLRSDADGWAKRLAYAPTLPRELRAEERYVFVGERFATMRSPTLLLVGGASPPREASNAEAVAAALPDARVAVLPGQHHVAMVTAPEAFVAEVARFLQA